jgi:hypothetical protein
VRRDRIGKSGPDGCMVGVEGEVSSRLTSSLAERSDRQRWLALFDLEQRKVFLIHAV